MARSRSAPLHLLAAIPEVASGRRETRGGMGRIAYHTAAPATAATTNTTPVIAAARRHSGPRDSGAADAATDPLRLACSSIAKSAVETSATRFRRSFSTQRRSKARIDAGTVAG